LKEFFLKNSSIFFFCIELFITSFFNFRTLVVLKKVLQKW
jgi:hypothetical protein